MYYWTSCVYLSKLTDNVKVVIRQRMSDRSTQLIEAALNVFMRFGVAKTTMHDIATEAGVARQTLYNRYASKEEILRGAVRHVTAETFKEVTQAWATAPTLAEKLDIFFEIAPLKWWDVAHGSPEGTELFDGIHRAANEELQQATLQWNTLFADLIRDSAPPDSNAARNAADIGAYVYATSINAKYNAASRDVVVMRLDILKQSTLALLANTSA